MLSKFNLGGYDFYACPKDELDDTTREDLERTFRKYLPKEGRIKDVPCFDGKTRTMWLCSYEFLIAASVAELNGFDPYTRRIKCFRKIKHGSVAIHDVAVYEVFTDRDFEQREKMGIVALETN